MRKIDITVFIFSIISAIIAYICGEILISFLYGKVLDEIVIGFYFAMIGVIIVGIICFCIYKSSKLKFEIPSKNIFLKSLQILIALTFSVLFVLGAGFEFLYSLGPDTISYGSNYIIAVDNSGSMAENDPNFKRFDALNELFSNMKDKQKIGVYVFSSESENVLPLQKIYKSKLNEYKNILEKYKISEGGTNLMDTLYDIIDYMDSNKLRETTNVIVISDGECDVNNNILDKLVSKKIAVHTIGVGDTGGINTYKSLDYISKYTRGNYYDINNVDELGKTLDFIYNLQTGHILTGRRSGLEADMYIYIIMRIIFIFVLAFIIKLMQLFIIDIVPLRKMILIQCFVFSTISCLCMEFIIQNFNIDENVSRFLMILFISLLFATHSIKNRSNVETFGLDFNAINNDFDTKGISDKTDEDRKSLK